MDPISSSSSGWMLVVVALCALTLAVSAFFAREVISAEASMRRAGSAASNGMLEIAGAIREGAHAFLRRQYKTVGLMAVVAVTILVALYELRGNGLAEQTPGGGAVWKVAVAFLIGGLCSAAAGFWGMFISLRANVVVAGAARSSVRAALRLALRGGAAAGLPVVAGSLLGVVALFFILGGAESPRSVPYQIVGFAFGASFVALFAQLGGGIYTKAADVGADLVGKVEVGIPEDDPRNPAVIADLVGDNVGDCAGRGADIFESASAENIGAMILGVALYPVFGIAGILFPLVMGSFGLIASIAGVLLAPTGKGDEEHPAAAVTRGNVVTLILAAVGLLIATRYLLCGHHHIDAGWLWLAGAGLFGLGAGFVISVVTRYYTGVTHRPVRFIAKSSGTGPTTNIMSGLSVGLESTALPILTVGVALFGAYWCGVHALPNVTSASAGLYGTAIAATGMLSTVGYLLSIDMFGPITDNAGGIVEMSGQPAIVRERTDCLDCVGNTTKATTKGYALGSAALAAFLLFSAYLNEVSALAHAKGGAGALEHIDIGKLPIFLAGLAGATVVFVFSGLAIHAVVRDAHSVIEEVRRQFHEHPDIMIGTTKPDYARCVDIVTVGALRGMIAPGLLAVGAPVVIGLVFRIIGSTTSTFAEDPYLAAEAVAAVLMVGTIVGILLGWVMNTGGAAWDNAKKLIETTQAASELGVDGPLWGKGSDVHRAAVVGDSVGDPLKDTAGPSLHILIKLLGTVALVTAPLFV